MKNLCAPLAVLLLAACATSDAPPPAPNANPQAAEKAPAQQAAAPNAAQPNGAPVSQPQNAPPQAAVPGGAPVAATPPEGAIPPGQPGTTVKPPDERVGADELADACKAVCKRAISCPPSGARITEDSCLNGCKGGPSGGAVRAGTDRMKSCAEKTDCGAFNSCMSGGGAKPSAPPAP